MIRIGNIYNYLAGEANLRMCDLLGSFALGNNSAIDL